MKEFGIPKTKKVKESEDIPMTEHFPCVWGVFEMSWHFEKKGKRVHSEMKGAKPVDYFGVRMSLLFSTKERAIEHLERVKFERNKYSDLITKILKDVDGFAYIYVSIDKTGDQLWGSGIKPIWVDKIE